jgi:sugar/nucleoside kinase (ribokinase family)
MSKGSNDYIEKILLDAQSHKIAFNPGSYLINHHIHLIHRLLPHISLLFVNKEEAQSITNNPDEEHIPHLIQLLHQLGADIVCLTDGINGAYVSNQSHILYAPSRIVSIAETTGAGDAFSAAFLGAYIQGKSLDTALKWGIIQSSSVIQHIGSTNGLIPQPEIELLLQDIIVETL